MHSTFGFICQYSFTDLHQWAGSREAEMDRGMVRGYYGLCWWLQNLKRVLPNLMSLQLNKYTLTNSINSELLGVGGEGKSIRIDELWMVMKRGTRGSICIRLGGEGGGWGGEGGGFVVRLHIFATYEWRPNVVQANLPRITEAITSSNLSASLRIIIWFGLVVGCTKR